MSTMELMVPVRGTAVLLKPPDTCTVARWCQLPDEYRDWSFDQLRFDDPKLTFSNGVSFCCAETIEATHQKQSDGSLLLSSIKEGDGLGVFWVEGMGGVPCSNTITIKKGWKR